MKPFTSTRFVRSARQPGPVIGPVALYCEINPHSGMRAKGLRSGTTASVMSPPPTIDLSHVTPIRATVSEALEAVRDRLMVTPEASFEQLLTDCRDRIEVVVRFLALLELYREGRVELRQAHVFGEIQVRWRG